ncbi:MAG TPA: hypothetical protein PLD20_20790 [Blastocatellia bacterium]|nr:hypothetical protein [Blastocatellia bacterium]HMX26010.1 hypothetical protein [Blastocatellia bacterium]HMY72408.1 hypothetical protein [Blastocatellia bacterium]HMZ20386.1 hypothetical protein [Blastocatellia bacterium]
MKRTLGSSIILAVLVLGACFAFLGKPSAATGLDWRIATDAAQFTQNPCPVEIVKIARADGKLIPLNEGFRSTEDALSGASITVRNVGNKKATRASLVFYLVDAQSGRVKAMSSYPMNVTDIAVTDEKSVAISAGMIEQMKRLSEKSDVPLTQLRLSVDWVGLSDGTRWMLGQTLVQHPDKPERWYPQGMPIAKLRELEARDDAQNGFTVENAKSSALWCECCHLGWIDFLDTCSGNGNCAAYEAPWRNWWYSPVEPGTFNIDTALYECSPGCTSYPWTWVSNCTP